jgi:hypothetical protein
MDRGIAPAVDVVVNCQFPEVSKNNCAGRGGPEVVPLPSPQPQRTRAETIHKVPAKTCLMDPSLYYGVESVRIVKKWSNPIPAVYTVGLQPGWLHCRDPFFSIWTFLTALRLARKGMGAMAGVWSVNVLVLTVQLLKFKGVAGDNHFALALFSVTKTIWW